MAEESDALRAEYDRLFQTGRYRLGEEQVEADSSPGEDGIGRGISAVIRLSPSTACRLCEVTSSLHALAGPKHFAYREDDLHITVCSLSSCREVAEVDNLRVADYVRTLRGIAKRYREHRVHFQGLTASSSVVMAQGWPVGPSFQSFRQELRECLSNEDLLDEPENGEARTMAHCSLVVFSDPVDNPAKLINFIDTHRDTEYGSSVARAIEVVRYERTPHSVDSDTITTIQLG